MGIELQMREAALLIITGQSQAATQAVVQVSTLSILYRGNR
jgi:hypothetical protein